ncbi:MAG: aminotransferase class I/II-fold pyridoxal phosphate-dependent enzyme [Candidatus Micrarchaeota archaeon]
MVTFEPNKRLEELAGEGGFIWLEKGKDWERLSGHKAIHLEIGEPDFPTPSNIIDATISALRDGKTKYTQVPGRYPLRKTIAEFLGKRRGVDIDPENILVSHGLKCIIRAVMETLTDPENPKNTAFILPDPGYGPYIANAAYTGATTYAIPMDERNDWRFDQKVFRGIVEEIPEHLRKVVVLVSPSNPTGGVLTHEDIEFVADLAKKHDMIVLSDEIYDDIVFEGEHNSIYSIPGMPERTCLLHGASKSWAMTGYRLGWGVFPKELTPYVERLVGHSNSCVAEFVQYAGVEALEGPQDAVSKMKEEYRKRRDYMVDALRGLGCYCAKPGGAFYVFPNVTDWVGKVGAKNDYVLAERLLNETGVICLPGGAFGRLGDNHVRFSLASSIENLREAVGRIEKWLALGGKSIF